MLRLYEDIFLPLALHYRRCGDRDAALLGGSQQPHIGIGSRHDVADVVKLECDRHIGRALSDTASTSRHPAVHL